MADGGRAFGMRDAQAAWLHRTPSTFGDLADEDRVFGDDLDCAVVLDVHDAAADGLPVRKIDEDAVAWSPAWLWLVHVDSVDEAGVAPSATFAPWTWRDGSRHGGVSFCSLQ